MLMFVFGLDMNAWLHRLRHAKLLHCPLRRSLEETSNECARELKINPYVSSAIISFLRSLLLLQ